MKRLIAALFACLVSSVNAGQTCYGYTFAGDPLQKAYTTPGAACAAGGKTVGASIDGSNYYCMDGETIAGTASFTTRECENTPDPNNLCQAGNATAGPITVPVPSLTSPLPSSFCDTRGVVGTPNCATNITSTGGASMRGCYEGGGCYVTFEQHTGQQTGATCDPAGLSSDPPLPADPKQPTPPITDPNAPPPGCTSVTDPKCGPLTSTPPGCQKFTRSNGPTVTEEIVCKQTTCGPSVCKTTSSTTTNQWSSSAGYRGGNPPDSSSTETTEKTQDRNPGGASSGGGASGSASNGGSSAGLMDTNGDGKMDGDIDGDGFCDLSCGSAGGSGSPAAAPDAGLQDTNGDGFMDGDTNKDGRCDISCGGTGSAGGGGAGGTGDSFCEENPDNSMCDKEGACPDGTETVGCMRPGTAEGEVNKADVNLSLKSSPVTFGGGGGCPAPATVSIGGATVNLTNPGPVCDALSSIVKPIVLLIAAFAAAMIIFRGFEV